MVETAFRLRDFLTAEGLDCRPKTTGGKGLHVMVPIERGEMDWDGAHAYTRVSPGAWRPLDRAATSRPRRWERGQGGSSSTTISAMGAGQQPLAPIRRARLPVFQWPHPLPGIRLRMGCGLTHSALRSLREPLSLDRG